jgi:hypothetical protein
MEVNVVVGETKPCSDLSSRLAMVYSLLLQLAEKAETGHRIEKQAPAGTGLAATPVEASEEPDFDNRIAVPHGPQTLQS